MTTGVDTAEESVATEPKRSFLEPLWIGRAIALVAGVLLLLYPLLSDDIYYQNMIILSLIFAVGTSGLNIISGFAGYISLGQGAFLGLGGYTVGVLVQANHGARRWVVKIGSALLTADGRGLDHAAMAAWVEQMVALRDAGVELVLVSSGAVAAGMSRLGWSTRPKAMRELQAAAAVGQMGLVQAWESSFAVHGRHTAQILLTHDDLSDRSASCREGSSRMVYPPSSRLVCG